MDKALDAADTAWLNLTTVDNCKMQVRALSADGRRALLAGIDKPPVLGYALQKQREGIGAGLPEREQLAAQMEWVQALPEHKRAALVAAQAYHARRLRAWVDACGVAVAIDGEDLGLTPADLLDSISDIDTAVGLLVEMGSVCEDYSTLGKAGPLCSERLCGPPTGWPGAGTVSDAPRPPAPSEGTAAASSRPTSAVSGERPTASLSETTQAG